MNRAPYRRPRSRKSAIRLLVVMKMGEQGPPESELVTSISGMDYRSTRDT